MKHILILLFLFSTAYGQVRQLNDFIYVFPKGSNVTTNTENGKQFVSVVTTDTLVRIYDNGITFWKANLQASNVSDTLSASGITGLFRITVPNSLSTNRIVQIMDIAIIIPNTYTVHFETFWSLPIRVKRNSDGVEMCVIYESGFIDWNVTPQWSWTGRVGTSRIKRITLP